MGEIGNLIGKGRSAEIYALGKDRVLKLFYENTPSSVVEREFHAAEQVARTGMPVPMPLGKMELLLRPGIIYQRIQGRLLSKELLLKPWTIKAQFIRMAELHSDIHSHTLEDLPDQREDFRLVISSLKNIEQETKLTLIDRLDKLPSGSRVCHMDFHPENIMITPGGAVVFDWLNAVKGNGLADVARTVMILRLHLPRPLHWGVDVYLGRYREIFPFKTQDFEGWLSIVAAARLAENIPKEREKLLEWIGQ